MENFKENNAWRTNGFLFLALQVVILLIGLFFSRVSIFLAVPIAIAFFVCMSGFLVIKPNQACVLVFFGQYIGSVREAGFHWVNPFAAKEFVSLKVNNFHSHNLKVNDAQGNPIEIGAVIVWRVVETAKALFDVEDYVSFVAIQSETAIRSLASHYPYDSENEHETSLRRQSDTLLDLLKSELQARLEVAGIEIIEARLSHLAYAPEIAQSMLRRQQAQAIIAARQKIVEGAVGMVQMALSSLSKQGIVELDESKKAAMVNNLLVALISEQGMQPVVNAGSN